MVKWDVSGMLGLSSDAGKGLRSRVLAGERIIIIPGDVVVHDVDVVLCLLMLLLRMDAVAEKVRTYGSCCKSERDNEIALQRPLNDLILMHVDVDRN